MSGPHDLGGTRDFPGQIDKSQHVVEDWERLTDAITTALDGKGIKTTDQHRRAVESLENYKELGYYERWAAATEKLLVEKGLLTKEEIDERADRIKREWGGK